MVSSGGSGPPPKLVKGLSINLEVWTLSPFLIARGLSQTGQKLSSLEVEKSIKILTDGRLRVNKRPAHPGTYVILGVDSHYSLDIKPNDIPSRL